MTTRPLTQWHRLFAGLLEELLTPVNITVQTEVPLLSSPPLGDILLLRRQGEQWTEAQRARLADGLRDTQATHVLLEFKYTQSINLIAFRQAISNDHLYRQSQKLPDEAIATFLISARQPRKAMLKEFHYTATKTPGVYRSRNPLLSGILLLSLNELADTPHNAFIKTFATQEQAKERAFTILQEEYQSHQLSDPIAYYLSGLLRYWSLERGIEMSTIELTPEKIKTLGREWLEFTLKVLPPDEILSYYSLEDRLAGLRPEDRLAGLRPEDRLAGLSAEEIEAYLRKLKQQKKEKNGQGELPDAATK